MKIALELQPCCWDRSGIGTYTYEIAKRLQNRDGIEFCGNLFNFGGKDDVTQKLEGITMPIKVNPFFSYGIYRRIWRYVPIPYQVMFPGNVDVSVFFNFIVPPSIKAVSYTHLDVYKRQDLGYLHRTEYDGSIALCQLHGAGIVGTVGCLEQSFGF